MNSSTFVPAHLVRTKVSPLTAYQN